jgi:menaquinone-dependent protoporphyrinogen oxidase
MRLLIVFQTSEGQTAKIAERVAAVLREHADHVDMYPVETAPPPDDYQGVIVGDSIHAVHHSKQMIRYLQDHVATMDSMPSALFQVCLTSANPDAEHTATAHALVQELLDATGFDPDAVGLFAGALLYTKYGWLKRHVMRAIVKREGGDLDLSRDYEYTDWDAVSKFAEDFHAIAGGAPNR